MSGIIRMSARRAAFVQERSWVVIKFCMLFTIVAWFISRNLGGLIIGFPVAMLVTMLAAAHWKIFDKASDAFLDVKEGDNTEEKGKKTVAAACKRIFYMLLDNGLAALSVSLVIAAKKAELSYLTTVAAMWLIIDISSTSVSIVLYERTGRDITLGRSYRRMANMIFRNSRLVGSIVFLYEITLASFWLGPDYTCLFFRDELKTRMRMIVFMVTITIAHSFLWTAVYWLSADDIAGLVGGFMR